MKRAGFIATVLLACGFAGVLAASVLADSPPGGTTTGTTTASTTTTTGTTTTVPTTTTAPTTTTTPAPTVLPEGVKVAGVPVGGLTPQAAVTAVREAFSAPLRLSVAGHVLAPVPNVLGATIGAQQAVDRARRAAPGAAIKAAVTVRRARVRAYLAGVATRFDRKPVDARLILRKLRPFITKDVPGRALDRDRATSAIVSALVAGRRGRIVLHSKPVRAETRRADFGSIVVIRRRSNNLVLYNGMTMKRTFHVATGQTRYPTPLGRFEVVVKWRNPWWYPPNSDWARGEKPIPPGPSNPLGTRWMGLSSPGVGIHGTNNDSSIGYSVSHGCIRMHVPDAEWLFGHVDIGTPVFIVAA